MPTRIAAMPQAMPAHAISRTLARSIGMISILCTLLASLPPTSFVGAILLTGNLGGALASHVRILAPLFFMHLLVVLALALVLWGGLWLGERLRRMPHLA